MPDKVGMESIEVSAYYKQDRPDMLAYIPRDASKILEFGCGCGTFSQLINSN